MKKMSAIILLFCCNALLIFLEVHKQGKYLKLSYEIQKLQAEIYNLSKQQNDLVYTLYASQQPDTIKETVQEKLDMKPIQLKNIKVSSHTPQEITKSTMS